jgi:hypothetical protein
VRRFLILVLVLLLAGALWRVLRRAEPAASDASASAAAPARPAGSTTAGPAPVPPAASLVPVPVAPPFSAPASPATVSRAVPTRPSAEILRTIAENAVPGRMVFLDFMLERDRLRLTGATGAAGRAKPSGPRPGFGFVHVEVFDAAGALILRESVEDPTRRRIEHPSATDERRIESTVQFSDEGPLAVRLPGELAAARIVFFRDKNPLAPAAAAREILGEFLLQPAP